MFYEVNLDDETQVLLEGQASGAMSKGGDGGKRYIPMDAFSNSMEVVTLVVKPLAEAMNQATQGSGCGYSVQFSVRADGNGAVMLAQTPDIGQFRITLTRNNT